MEPHDILLVLLIVNHLRPLDDVGIRDIGVCLRRKDVAYTLPRDEVATTVAVDADETGDAIVRKQSNAST
jgi:hypothetical protein